MRDDAPSMTHTLRQVLLVVVMEKFRKCIGATFLNFTSVGLVVPKLRTSLNEEFATSGCLGMRLSVQSKHWIWTNLRKIIAADTRLTM